MTQLPLASVVIDSSALVALLADAGPIGQWVEVITRNKQLTAPQLVLFEAANVLRRLPNYHTPENPPGRANIGLALP